MGPSLVRTVVPLIVGWLLSLPLAKWFGVTSDQLVPLVTVVVASVYYAVVRWLEQHVSSRFGWLLGLAKQPVYPAEPRPLTQAP